MKKEQDVKNKKLREEKNEIWVGKDEIIHLKVVKISTEEEVMKLIEEIKEVAKGFQGKASILIDISVNSIIRSSKFRKKTAERIMGVAKDPGFKKTAVFGGNIITKTIASFIIMASGVKNMKIFKTEEEAFKWLKQP